MSRPRQRLRYTACTSARTLLLDILGGVAVGLMSGGLVLVVAQWQSRRVHPTNALTPIAHQDNLGGRVARNSIACVAARDQSSRRARELLR